MEDLKTCKVTYPFVGAVDISIAFLNSPIPEGRKIFLRPPPAFVRAGLIPEDAMYAVERGVYGLREAAKWWADMRTKDLKKVQVTLASGEVAKLYQSTTHSSLWILSTSPPESNRLRRWLMMPSVGRIHQEHPDISWSVSNPVQSRPFWEST
eukprot:3099278-Amphidinium_carterae.6